jgi:hypothetical protein
VLFEQPQLRELLGLAVSSYNLALPVRWGASGSARGRLGRLALVTKEERGAREVGDDGQELHASAAARASFDVDAGIRTPNGVAVGAELVNLPAATGDESISEPSGLR